MGGFRGFYVVVLWGGLGRKVRGLGLFYRGFRVRYKVRGSIWGLGLFHGGFRSSFG